VTPHKLLKWSGRYKLAAPFDFKRSVKQPRRDGAVDDFTHRKCGFDTRDPWQSGNFLPVNELIILN
jgi:hypothetical protein